MTKAVYLGARLDDTIVRMVELTAQEEHLDKTSALKELIIIGRRQFLIDKHLNDYRLGRCSLDKAASLVGITISEMMQEAAKVGIRSTETIEEFRRGLKLLK